MERKYQEAGPTLWETTPTLQERKERHHEEKKKIHELSVKQLIAKKIDCGIHVVSVQACIVRT
jgi:hypothetical protein